MSGQLQRWHLFEDTAGLVDHAAAAVRDAAAEALARNGRFDIVLAGGTTPRALYERLAADEAGSAGWHVWFGDERCLEAGHADRNETMARESWLDGAAIEPAQIHGVPPGPDPVAAARLYAGRVAEVDAFDLVLLGIGEDGHTASLFPGHVIGAGEDAPDVLAVRDAPKPPPARVSLSARRLSLARRVLILVTGAGKAEAVAAWRRGADLPVCHIRPAAGVDILLDRAALPPDGA